MTREDLMERAKGLGPVSETAAREYRDKAGRMAHAVTGLLLSRDDLEALIGKGNEAMMSDNHTNHARFIGSILSSPDPTVLVETVLWVFKAYRAHGFQLTYWPAQLNAWVDVMRAELTGDTFAEVYPLYDWMIVNQAAFAGLSERGQP